MRARAPVDISDELLTVRVDILWSTVTRAFGRRSAKATAKVRPPASTEAVKPPIPRVFGCSLGAVALELAPLALRVPAAQSAVESASDGAGLPFVGAKSRLNRRDARRFAIRHPMGTSGNPGRTIMYIGECLQSWPARARCCA